MYSEELGKICSEHKWSYLHTKENNLSLVQNIAINLRSRAKYIFKIDEDIIITENYFDNMIRAYHHAEKSKYIPGVLAPLIPINGYGHVRILEKLQIVDKYENKFGKIKVATGFERPIENNADVAKFFWGSDGNVPFVDELNSMFANKPLDERPCPIRFSIGAILFERKLWENMRYFKVKRNMMHMVRDEHDLYTFCTNSSKPIMVNENVDVGHLSFNLLNEAMKQFYNDYQSIFKGASLCR